MGGTATGRLVTTGIPNLDLILGGGVPAGDVLLVTGPAGAGKTTLCFQLLFHAAAAGENVLYVATLSEPTIRLLAHLRSFRFYDEGLISKRLFLLNVYPLAAQSLDAVTAALVAAVREHRATLVAIDGLMTLGDLHPTSRAKRGFIYELGTTLTAEGCTTVLTSVDVPPAEEYRFPAWTMTDGIVDLGSRPVGTAITRTIQVRKLRGLRPLLGPHTMRIDDAGLTVFPRLESTIVPRDVGLSPERAPLGLPELDAMMHGGPLAGSTSILAGALGTGKTLTCLQFILTGARRGEPGLILGFRETPRQLVDKARAFGLDLQGALDAGQVAILYRAPIDLPIDEITWELRQAIDRWSPTRLAIDSFVELEDRLDGRRQRDYLAALIALLRNRGITALVSKEIPQVIGPELDFSDTPLAVLVENLIMYRWVEYRSELVRIVSILKMRDSAYDSSIRQYTISAAGLQVRAKVETGEGLLSGVARLPAETRRGPRRGRDV